MILQNFKLWYDACPMINLLLIFTAFLLVFLNAFFVAAEFGMIKLRITRVAAIKKRYGLRGQILATIQQQLDSYLSACQLGITLTSLGLGWIGEPAFAKLLGPMFAALGFFSPELVTVFSFFTAFLFISFLHIVVGELMPKSLAIRQAEKISVWTAVPLYVFYWLMFPAIWILNNCALYLLKWLGLGASNQGDAFYSTDELKLILNTSHLHGELSKDEAEILEHTLDFADLKVTDVMRPREDMVMLNLEKPIEETLKIIMETRYSRYPVFDETTRDVVGVIHVKDLFALFYENREITSLHTIIRPILKVKQRSPALDLLRQFRDGMPHFALVYRGAEILGFVTLDNLLHILIGRVKDEFHRTQDDWHVHRDGSLTVRGDCPLASLERALDRDIDSGSEPAETITGLILNRLGKLPNENDHLTFREFKVVIKKMRGHRILKIRIYPRTKQKD